MSDTPSMYVQVTRTGLAALEAENAALRESRGTSGLYIPKAEHTAVLAREIAAAERKGMERALEIVDNLQSNCGWAIAPDEMKAAIRAAMEE